MIYYNSCSQDNQSSTPQLPLLPLCDPPNSSTNHPQIRLSPELVSHAYPSLDLSSDQINQRNVSDTSESLRPYIFNNLEGSGSGICLSNAPGNLESSPSSPSQSLEDSAMIIDLGGLYSWENSFNADAQHSDNLAGTSFQFGDVNMDEARVLSPQISQNNHKDGQK